MTFTFGPRWAMAAGAIALATAGLAMAPAPPLLRHAADIAASGSTPVASPTMHGVTDVTARLVDAQMEFTRLAFERARTRGAMPCSDVQHCIRPTVFIDGRPIGEGVVATSAVTTWNTAHAASTDTAAFTRDLVNPESALARLTLLHAAIVGLARADASTLGVEVTDAEVDDMVQATRTAEADPLVGQLMNAAGPDTTPAHGSSAERLTYRSLLLQRKAVAVVQEYNGKQFETWLRGAATRHTLQMSPASQLTVADLIAMAAAN